MNATQVHSNARCLASPSVSRARNGHPFSSCTRKPKDSHRVRESPVEVLASDPIKGVVPTLATERRAETEGFGPCSRSAVAAMWECLLWGGYAKAPGLPRNEPFWIPSNHPNGVLGQGEIGPRRVPQLICVSVVGELGPRDPGVVE